MGRAVSPRNLQGKDPHWLGCFGLSEMPAAPALLEAAVSSAPSRSHWPARGPAVDPESCRAAMVLGQPAYGARARWVPHAAEQSRNGSQALQTSLVFHSPTHSQASNPTSPAPRPTPTAPCLLSDTPNITSVCTRAQRSLTAITAQWLLEPVSERPS